MDARVKIIYQSNDICKKPEGMFQPFRPNQVVYKLRLASETVGFKHPSP